MSDLAVWLIMFAAAVLFVISTTMPWVVMKKTYAYHKPSADGLSRISVLRAAFSNIHDLIETTAPATRERSIALTNLETAAMWAIKAVVCNDPESEVSP